MADRLQIYIVLDENQDLYRISIDAIVAGRSSTNITTLYMDYSQDIPIEEIQQYGAIVRLNVYAREDNRLQLRIDDIDTVDMETLHIEHVDIVSVEGLHLFLLQHQQSLSELTLEAVSGADSIEVVDVIPTLTNLRALHIVATDIGLEDNVILDLNNLVQLEELALQTSQLTRLPDIEQCINLRHIALDSADTEVRDRLDDIDLSNLSTLYTLTITCHTGGPMPYWLYNLPNISEIDLSNNELEGTIDSSSLWNKDLHSLDLSHNRLTGYIDGPIEIDHLDLSYNQFVGAVPAISAETVYLNNNNFIVLAGPISASDTVDLSYNNIVADIGYDFFQDDEGQYPESIDLYGNDFGTIVLHVDVEEGTEFTYSIDRTVVEPGSGWEPIEEEGDKITYLKEY